MPQMNRIRAIDQAITEQREKHNQLLRTYVTMLLDPDINIEPELKVDMIRARLDMLKKIEANS